MKIAIMSRWNATCGVSLHAELIGRKLISLGHSVIVYAPTLDTANRDWHHRYIDVSDERWVHRVYGETEEYMYPHGGWINTNAILDDDYDAFIVEGYARFPIKVFKKISSKIKRKAPLILVLHTSNIRDTEPFMSIDWDAIVVFDRRYIDEILTTYGSHIVKKAIEIPYPHAIIDAKPYRPKFAEDKILFFTFGRQPVYEYLDYVYALRSLSRKYDLIYWIIRSDGKLPFSDEWMVQWQKRMNTLTLHRYLRGSDIHLLPKGDTSFVVVSSTICQTLYSGTPTIVPNTRHFELLPVNSNGIGPIVKYRRAGDIGDLVSKIVTLIEDEDLRLKVSEDARRYALKYSDESIARTFLDLIESLISVRMLEAQYILPLSSSPRSSLKDIKPTPTI